MNKNLQLLWKDRKRFLGMPITFTKYAMSDDRVFQEKGLLNLSLEEVILYRVRDISLIRTLGQRIFGVGSVVIHSSDKTTPHLELKNIKNPEEVKELIYQQVEKMKAERRMRVEEQLSDEDCEHDDGLVD